MRILNITETNNVAGALASMFHLASGHFIVSVTGDSVIANKGMMSIVSANRFYTMQDIVFYSDRAEDSGGSVIYTPGQFEIFCHNGVVFKAIGINDGIAYAVVADC